MKDSDLYCIVEVSLFPMTGTYATEVADFVGALAGLDFDMSTSETSTILRGPYDEIMAAITGLMRETLSKEGKRAVVLKLVR